MKQGVKRALSAVLILVLLLAGMFSYTQIKIKYYEDRFFPMKENFNELEQIVSWVTCYAYDISDLRKNVGFYDYVFVGRIEEAEGTYYRDSFFSEKLQFYAQSETQYKITVLKNIKGNLKTNESIPMTKDGGLSCKGKYIEIGSGDPMPLEGHYYVLFAAADEKGNVSLGVGNTLLGTDEEKATDENNPTVKKIMQAYENQDESVRLGERYKSEYEK